MAPVPTDPYYVRLRRLREERGLSRPQLFRLTNDTGLDTLVALEKDPGNGTSYGRARYPSADTLEDIAQALEIEPDEFPEYRLAKARQLLDERAVGLDQALATLTRFETALQERAAQRSATSTERAIRNRRRSQTSLTATSTPQADVKREP